MMLSAVLSHTLSFGIVLVALVGCGAKQQPWGSVSGTITRDGKPIEPALVLFSNREAGIEMTGNTNEDGRFTIRTDRLAGLPAGTYKVVVTPSPVNMPLPEQGMMFKDPPPQLAQSTIPMAVQELATTSLTATVKEGENEFTFELGTR